MKKIAAAIQIVIVLAIIGFGTFELFRGNFAVSMATVPMLVLYYLLITALNRGK